MGAIIQSVDEDGIGRAVGLEPGDEILAVDGHSLRDVIDYRFHLASEEVTVLVRKAGGEMLEIEIEKDLDDGLGVEFGSPLFDGLMECNNHCVFCFVNQMPSDARASTLLYDDDYRLSFLDGNFVTLSNVRDEDVERILRMRLSPLYVSVHCVDPSVRRQLFRSKEASRGLEVLWRLLDGGITVHTQVVMAPGLNDGHVLADTVEALAARHPRVASLGIVPVGLTSHRSREPRIEPVCGDLARQTLGCIHQWQARFLHTIGTRFCFGADELYLLAGLPIPAGREYEDYPQVENGIGMCGLFRDELRRSMKRRGQGLHEGPHYTALTGTSAAPFLREVLDSVGLGGRLEVVAVPNRYLGETVTVAGLMAGEDLWQTIREHGGGSYLLPEVCVSAEGLLIDGLRLAELQRRVERLGGTLDVVEDAAGLVRLLRRRGDAT